MSPRKGKKSVRCSTAVSTLIAGFALLACLGCTSASAPRAFTVKAENAAKQEVPFSLEVIDEVNDGQEMHLRVRLTSEVSWDAAQLAMRVSGLNAGQAVMVNSYALRALLEREGVGDVEMLPPEVLFSLTFPAASLTDYQLELLWGDEALEVLRPLAAGAGGLVLKNISVQERRDCGRTPCQFSYQVDAEFFNDGKGMVDKAVLGVRYALPGQTQTPEEGEEQVEISGLGLAAGESRVLQVELDKVIVQDQKAVPRPVIRIVSYQ